MIIFGVVKKNNIILDLTISGHANQNDYGNDVVCAAASTALYVCVNLIEKFKLKKNIKLELKSGYSKISVIEKHQDLNNILGTLEYTLVDLGKQYPKYIKKEG